MEVSHHDNFLLKQMVGYARGFHYVDNETAPIPSLWCFDDGGSSLPRGLQYGDEIPSLSRKKYNEASRGLQYGDVIPSLSRKKYTEASRGLQYGDEIPSLSRKKYTEASRGLLYGEEIPSLSHRKYNGAPPFSRRRAYGDGIPSLSRNWCYRDMIQSHTGHWCHGADARSLTRYQQCASHGNGHSRHNFARTDADEQVRLAASKHTFTKPMILNRVVNSSDHYRTNIKDKPRRNSEAISKQVRGPRANKIIDASGSSTESYLEPIGP
jgi:hypothetical protein